MIPNTFAKTVKESLGYDNISEGGYNKICAYSRKYVFEIVKEAVLWIKRDKRNRLTGDDLNQVLVARGQEPIFFYGGEGFVSLKNGEEYFYVYGDKKKRLRKFPSVPPPPLGQSIFGHWLVIDGIQQNVSQQFSNTEQRTSEKADDSSENAFPELREHYVIHRNLEPHEVSLEFQQYYRKVTEIMFVKNENVKRVLLPIVKKFISFSSSIKHALRNLSRHINLQVLAPRFVTFIQYGVKCNIAFGNALILNGLLRLAEALIGNPALDISLYLHEMLPAMISIVLCEMRFKRGQNAHWKLREFAARIIGQLYRRYKDVVFDMRERVLNCFVEFMPKLETHSHSIYGAICTISELGSEAVEEMLLPWLPELTEKIRYLLSLKFCEEPSSQHCTSIKRIISTITRVLSDYAEYGPKKISSLIDFQMAFGFYLGAKVHRYSADSRRKKQSGRPSVRKRKFHSDIDDVPPSLSPALQPT